MHRRHLLAGAAAVVTVGSAGCTDGSGGGSDPRTTVPPMMTTATEPTAGLSAVTLVPRECSTPGDATVRLDGGPVTVVGCVVGKNGCTRPRVASVDRDDGAVTVVIAAVEEREEGEACTEALVNLGYEARIDHDDPLTSVTVVHDDVDSRRVVADVTQ